MNTFDVIIYTDGSCIPNPGKGGWAYIAFYKDSQIIDSSSNCYTTNNIMEMTSVIEALKKFYSEKKIKIITDSTYVINCAQGKWKRNKNIELWKQYDIVSKNKQIVFEWVKGHSGDKYNDMVDKIAKNAILKN